MSQYHGPSFQPGAVPTFVPPPAEHQVGAWRRSRRPLIVLLILVPLILLALVVALLVVTDDPDQAPVDRASPESVATVFVQRYATHDSSVCELVTPRLYALLERQGRCAGRAGGDVPALMVLVSKTCGDKHGFGAQVTPPGEVGKPYIAIGVNRVGTEWLVDDLLPIQDRVVLRPYECDRG